MENKYLINIIYHKPYLEEGTTEIQLLVKSTSFSYENLKDAQEAYESFTTTKSIEFDTPAGIVCLNILLVEFMDVERFNLNTERNNIIENQNNGA